LVTIGKNGTDDQHAALCIVLGSLTLHRDWLIGWLILELRQNCKKVTKSLNQLPKFRYGIFATMLQHRNLLIYNKDQCICEDFMTIL